MSTEKSADDQELPGSEGRSPAEQSGEARGWITTILITALAAGAGVLLTVGIGGGRDQDPAGPATGTGQTITPAAPPSSGFGQTGGVLTEPDQAVKAWNDGVTPMIRDTLAILAAAPAETLDDLQGRCRDLERMLGQLAELPAAPRQDVAITFGVWQSEVADQVAACLTLPVGDDAARRVVEQDLAETSLAFDYFLDTVTKYVNLGG